MPKKDVSWQAPPFTALGPERQGWIEEACIQEGENWLKGQRAYSDIPKSISIIAGQIAEDANQKRSQLNINRAKYLLRKVVETLSDTREVGKYSSGNKIFQSQVEMFNKTACAAAKEGNFVGSLRQCLQYMVGTAKGYLWPRATRMNGEDMKIEFYPLGFMDVLPVQLPSNNDLQKAYSVTIIIMMPVWEAHGRFPWCQHSLLPIARRRYTSTISARRLDLAERFRYGDSTGANWDNLYCEIRYTFIRDLAINETKDTVIPMGIPDTSWSYDVPYIGQEIPAGMGLSGKVEMRKAEPEDCMLYPYRRLMISSRGMRKPIYDGPAKDWHGQVPLAEYCADDWPWEPGGFSLTHDIFTIERSRQSAERLVDQLLKARLDPTLAYDRQAGLNDGTAQSIDPFEERGRVGVDGDPEKVFRALLPDRLLEVPSAAEAWIKYLIDSEDKQLGLNEIQALAEFKANLQNDNAFEKALGFVGPLIKGIASGMERSTGTVWDQMRFLIPQYLTTKRVMQWVGPDGVSPETFDFDPESILPSHGLDEFLYMAQNTVVPQKSIYTPAQRARTLAKNIVLLTVPGTMHDITQTQEQMKFLQLYRGGFPIAPHDVAKKLNIENYGEIDGATYFERWFNWQKIEIRLKAQLARLAQSEMPAPPPGDETGTGPKGGQKGTGGRAPTGKQAPKIKQKTGAAGPRTVVSESG